jgi:hypothetical protein
MPELTVKEVRLPELHLPELKRDEIVRALTEIHVPDVDLTKLDLQRPDRLPFDVSGPAIGKALASALGAIRLVAPVVRRPRWPVAIGIVAVLGVIAIVLFRTPAVREGTERAARAARERVDAMRASAVDAGATATDSIPSIGSTPMDPGTTDVADVITSIEDAAATAPSPTPA